jgi:hypothetical protein
MSNLQLLVEKFAPTVQANQSYVYYNKEDGKIHKISGINRSDNKYLIFPVDTDEVLPILSGQKKTDDFIIRYDVSSKQIVLKEIQYEDEFNAASTMTYELPVIKNAYEGHRSLHEVYQGVNVYLWSNDFNYLSGQCIWYNDNVYKLKSDVCKNFNALDHTLLIENVLITDLPTQDHVTSITGYQPEYVGIHVDIWYKELKHVKGQHVFINNNVYKFIKNVKSDTEFNIKNVELIVSGVKLFQDENKSLTTEHELKYGDIILKNNSLYSVIQREENYKKDKKSIFFYYNNHTIIFYEGENQIIDLETNESIGSNIDLSVTDYNDLSNGQIVLCSNRLYQLETSKDYDIIVKQNTIDKTWCMTLNPYTKKFLKSSGHLANEKLYFSVTSKYEPNILYRSLEFSIGDLVTESPIIPFIYESENSVDNVSIYTAKYFDSYAHEVI